MKTNLLIILLLSFFSLTSFSQKSITDEDKSFMISIVEKGLEAKPKSFFNKGTSYDYKTNVVVHEITIPTDQTYTGIEGRTVMTFFCKLRYSIEGEETTTAYKILIRKNSETQEMDFYSANQWDDGAW